VRAAQRRHQPTGEELSRVGDRTSRVIEDDSFRHRFSLLRGKADLLHRRHGGGYVQDHGLMTLGGEAVRERVGAEDRRPTAGRGHQRNEVGASEADQAGLGCQSGVGRRDQELPVPDRGDGHALARVGALDTPLHSSGRHAGATAAISVEEDCAVRLLQHARARARVQVAVAVESGQNPKRCDPVVGVAAKLGVHQ
jgi:hypothetical protein